MRFLVCCAVLIAAAIPAFPSLVASNQVVLCSTGPACQTLASQSTTLNYSNTVTSGVNSITVTGFADEDLATLALKASATYSEPSPESFYVQYQSVAGLSDTFTISDPALNGTVGFLEIPFTITGTVSPSGLGEISVFLNDSAGGLTAICTTSSAPCFFAGNANIIAGSAATGTLSFHYGDPFTLSWLLGAVTFPSTTFQSGSSDYSHTATFSGFELFDSNGQLVTDATIKAAGGESVGLVTPEPQLAIPMLLCFGSIVLVRRLRPIITSQ